MRDMYYQCKTLNELNQRIREDVKAKLECGGALPARIFVTFDSEEDQRTCLDIMSVGSMWAYLDMKVPEWLLDLLVCLKCKSVEDAELVKFKTSNGNVLMVREAPEPEDVQWENMDEEPIHVFLRSCMMNFVAVLIVSFMGIIIYFCFDDPDYVWLGAIFISLSNTALPPPRDYWRGIARVRWD